MSILKWPKSFEYRSSHTTTKSSLQVRFIRLVINVCVYFLHMQSFTNRLAYLFFHLEISSPRICDQTSFPMVYFHLEIWLTLFVLHFLTCDKDMSPRKMHLICSFNYDMSCSKFRNNLNFAAFMHASSFNNFVVRI